ncbi:2-keto-4-pentenoate hydratase [Bacillus cereus]|uniref:2-keto-4-pentenoate hydratase n=2 Tax=Bacillus cereus group TaxID=86661 RepID=A0AA44KWK2_9BACI|nr:MULTISPECIES: 2-keto-4-pentenoate hydratase [Bacillus cereus group]MDM5238862.1 2-keto-4-pentenoate hydratase [Bacillus cereus]MDR4984952.1 2-keto-4-pentenoate hydratase [Bacillus cereus]MEA1009089.1 2-keto-4-pentenoate hydratase [Bacillus cereus]OJE46585.1 2-keto-4-pentenoate hydratase [Bacillus proteolyticus]PES96227.1 2-keto-4-pentenoate hydratase [Bacillus cereus]
MLIKELADELVQAENSRVGILPFTERYDNLSVEDAYNIQLEVVGRKLESGRSIIGKKVGLTSVAMQQMLGVNEPDYGHLLDDMKIESGSEVSMSSFVSPKIEAEIGFVLEQDLNGPNITYIDVLMATKYVVPTLEIIDSRIADWKIKLADTVADNGSSAKVVIGNTFSSIDKVDLRTTGMTLYKNNSLIATGAGAAALGHPAQAIAWLANKLYEFNIGLKAGELILPGALSGAVSVQSEDNIRADFGLLGSVSVTFI